MKSQTLYQLDPESLAFPPTSYALSEPNGLLALGGDLSPQRLVSAYQQGIFPWFNEGEEIMWWSPDPRAVIPISRIHVNRTLKKVINRKTFTVSLNKAFDEVVDYCADAPFRNEDTWIIPTMQVAYQRLHQLGFAHSIEVWCDDELVGGLYGVAINGFFSGESMFYKCANASKIALVTLSTLLKEVGVNFIDCQIINPFLADMGCVEIPRDEFLSLQQDALLTYPPELFWQPRSLSIL
jgi:leucyl/phenylalanyl-tRNA--protein transferase